MAQKKGYKHTEEAKRKMSKVHRGKKRKLHSRETKRKISDALKGNIISLETRRKISKKMKGKNHHMFGKHRSKETKKKISETSKGKIFSIQTKKKMSIFQLNRWNKFSKKERLKITRKWRKAGLLASQEANPSSIEIVICKVLDSLNIRYEIQYHVGRWFVDIYIHNKNLIIECNGDYWHNLSRVKKRDKQLENYVKENGYKIIWLWESNIKENSKKALMEGLENVN